jgi:lysophospholipase L1-like esterase
MLAINSSFLGHPKSYKYSKFFGGSDAEVKFKQSLITQSPDWEYRSIDFDYRMNSYGHRSKDITELDLDNYILCVGCSYTEGVGVPVEKRYTDLLANKLNCDLYNMGLGGTGNDVIFYNLVTWFSKIKNKPKFVIVQWSDPTRFVLAGPTISQHGVWDNHNTEFIATGDENTYFQSKTAIFKQLIRTIVDVPLIELPWEDFHDDRILCAEPKHELRELGHLSIDLARDLMHPGIKSNELLAEHIYQYLTINL